VIGQPCEAAALEKARKIRPGLDQKIGLVLSFFCAGSPSTQGTVDLLKRSGVERDTVNSLRYRGNGWPGHFVAYQNAETEPSIKMTYADSWHILQKYRPYSVHLWPDDTGEAADISCGDPWYQKPNPGDIGSSLLVVRTENGRRIIESAIAAGYLSLTKAEPWKLVKSQANLSIKRRAIIGRRLAFRLFGLPLTRIKGLHLITIWFGLSFRDKLASFFGTIRRIVARKYYRPRDLA
jgi:coenzyme F420 hydrogenase subunit beta